MHINILIHSAISEKLVYQPVPAKAELVRMIDAISILTLAGFTAKISDTLLCKFRNCHLTITGNPYVSNKGINALVQGTFTREKNSASPHQVNIIEQRQDQADADMACYTECEQLRPTLLHSDGSRIACDKGVRRQRLSKTVTQWCNQAGLSYEQLACKMKILPTSVARIEANSAKVSFKSVPVLPVFTVRVELLSSFTEVLC